MMLEYLNLRGFNYDHVFNKTFPVSMKNFILKERVFKIPERHLWHKPSHGCKEIARL